MCHCTVDNGEIFLGAHMTHWQRWLRGLSSIKKMKFFRDTLVFNVFSSENCHHYVSTKIPYAMHHVDCVGEASSDIGNAANGWGCEEPIYPGEEGGGTWGNSWKYNIWQNW